MPPLEPVPHQLQFVIAGTFVTEGAEVVVFEGAAVRELIAMLSIYMQI
jgi:hypothetical protein